MFNSRSVLLQWWQVAVQTIKDPCLWTLIEFKRPKERGRNAKMITRRAKVRMPKVKDRKEKENKREKKAIRRANEKAKTRREKVWQLVTLCRKPGHLARDC